MAEGPFIIFQAAFERMLNGGGYQVEDLSTSMHIMLLKNDFTASATTLDIASWSASLSPVACVLSADAVVRALTSTVFTMSTSNIWKFDANNVTLCASVGLNLSAMYAVILQSAVTAPLCICQLSTAPIIANKVIVEFGTEGIFEISQSASALPGTP